MRIAIASEGRGLEAPMADVFGRCRVLLFVDVESGEVEALDNPAWDAQGGAGVEAARFVVDHGAKVIMAPRLGPKAQDVLDGAGVRHVVHSGGTTGGALAAYREHEAA